MKKWYRIGICLVLAVCLLLLSACAGSAPSASDPVHTVNQAGEGAENLAAKTDADAAETTGNDPTAQTEAAAGNDPASQTEATSGNDSTKEPGENAVTLNYKVSFVRGGKSELTNGAVGGVGYGELLDYESCKEFFESGVTNYRLSYPKEFFDDHSLILLGITKGSGSAIMELSEVRYKNGSVYCFLEHPTSSGIGQTSDMAYWYCLIEVDTVLPKDTRVMRQGESVIYDKETYEQKHKQFNEQCIK